MNNQIVFDVGMNNGDDTAYYLHCGYRVIAIEADPRLCDVAATRFVREIAEKRLVIRNVAISDQDKDLPFWICEAHSEWSSFHESVASRGGAPHHQIMVKGCHFGSLLDEYGVPHFMKIDIEGSDWLCIEALKGRTLPRYLSIEQSARVLERLDFLRDLGFTGFKCISQHHFLPVQDPMSDEERKYSPNLKRLLRREIGWKIIRRLGLGALDRAKVSELRSTLDWRFPPGSSGPFGEATGGRWLDHAEFKATVLRSNAAFAAG